MSAYLLQRLLSSLVVIAGVVVLVFLLMHLIPGDPVDVMLGEGATLADRAALAQALGLERPLHAQLGSYLGGLLRADLGESVHSGRAITALLAERLPATIELAVAALLLAVLLALPLGLLAAARRDSLWDRLAMGFSLLGVSIPNFWLGPLLVMGFSVGLGWLPVSGREGWSSLVLPALTLGSGLAAVLARMTRAAVLEVLGEDYIRTARAKGLSRSTVLWRHALPNALLPLLTVLGLQFGVLLGGAVITETVFSWPGIGLLLIEAIQTRDYPVVQACVLVVALSYVLVNLATDLAYAAVDPRVRLAGRG